MSSAQKIEFTDVNITLSNSSLDEGTRELYVLWIKDQFINYYPSQMSAKCAADEIIRKHNGNN